MPTPTFPPASTATPFTALSPAPHPSPSPSANCVRPYTNDSPWNIPIGPNPGYHPDSDKLISALSGFFGSNPEAYTYPVYYATNSTPLKTVRYSGTYKYVTGNDSGVILNSGGGTVKMPIPDGARQSPGTDGQMIVINQDTGDEWSFWQGNENPDGTWSATNVYKYNIHLSAYPPARFGRGAGIPYLAGLIRPCEIAQGHIEHALAFSYDYPCSKANCASRGIPYCVYPATNSDGKGNHPYAFPEGTRLQLDPKATEAEIRTWCGKSQACRVIVKAMQEYGMYVVDSGGHPGIYVESSLTANWMGILDENTISGIPYSAFRILDFSRLKQQCPLPRKFP